LLIDEGQYGADVLNPLRNLVAALFRLETQRTIEDVRNVVDALIEWLKDEGQRTLRLSFTIWLKLLLRTKLPGANIDGINDLRGVRSMLGENIQSWFDEYREKGRQAGLHEGEVLGLQKGEVQGLQKGEALALQRLLSKRFGAIPSNIIEQISAASVEQIEIWFDSAIDARELTDVFGVI
jgi:hypothetical protein